MSTFSNLSDTVLVWIRFALNQAIQLFLTQQLHLFFNVYDNITNCYNLLVYLLYFTSFKQTIYLMIYILKLLYGWDLFLFI